LLTVLFHGEARRGTEIRGEIFVSASRGCEQ